MPAPVRTLESACPASCCRIDPQRGAAATLTVPLPSALASVDLQGPRADRGSAVIGIGGREGQHAGA